MADTDESQPVAMFATASLAEVRRAQRSNIATQIICTILVHRDMSDLMPAELAMYAAACELLRLEFNGEQE